MKCLGFGNLLDLVLELDAEIAEDETLGVADCSCNWHTQDIVLKLLWLCLAFLMNNKNDRADDQNGL